MAISKANKEGISEKYQSNVPFPKFVTVPFCEAATSSVSSLQHQGFLSSFSTCVPQEQLVRENGYFRTFPPIAKAAHSIFCKIMDLQNFIVVDCSPLCSAQGILLPHNHSHSESGKLVVNVFLCPHICFMGNEKKSLNKKREEKSGVCQAELSRLPLYNIKT